MTLNFAFTTSTASLAVFDPEALLHRHDDRADWWSSPPQELAEVNAGNMFLVDLGRDGEYAAKIKLKDTLEPPAVAARIRCISGSVMIGPGEVLPGGGMGPSKHGGGTVDLQPGVWEVRAKRIADWGVALGLKQVGGEAENNVDFSMLIDEPNLNDR